MRFNYVATTPSGKTVRGTLESLERDAALSMLSKQNLKPIVLKVADDKTFRAGFGKRVGMKDLVVFTRQLSTMVSAGVGLPRSLNTLMHQTQNKYFQNVISGVVKEIEGGTQLSAALARYPNVFSPIYINMVRAGEAGGILEDVLKRLASQIEKDATIRKKVIGAMTYPLVILSITIIAFFFIMIFLMPQIGKIIKGIAGPKAQLPIYTQVLLDFSSFIQNYIVFILIGSAIAIYAITHYIKTPKGKRQLHAVILKVPILNMIIIKIAMARFARTFSALMSAGVGVIEALNVTSGAIGNKIIEEELIAAAEQVKNGKQLSEPLSKSKLFPQIVSEMLAVGEETGQIDTILIKIADFYEEEVDTIIDSLSSIIEPLLIVVLGALVGLIAASVMGPLASLNNTVGS